MKEQHDLPISLGENILMGPWRPIDNPKTLGDRIPYGSSIYFVGGLGYIKIGYSADFKRRFNELTGSFPVRLEIIACIGVAREIGLKTEASIHRDLQDYKSNGEWFLDCDEVRDVAYAGLQSGFAIPEMPKSNSGRPINNSVAWAADSLKRIAHPIELNETVSNRIKRAANIVNMSHSRAFEIWYLKARRILEPERARIKSVLNGAVK